MSSGSEALEEEVRRLREENTDLWNSRATWMKMADAAESRAKEIEMVLRDAWWFFPLVKYDELLYAPGPNFPLNPKAEWERLMGRIPEVLAEQPLDFGIREERPRRNP